MILIGGLESIGLLMVVRLWLKKPKVRLSRKLFVSLVLLVPALGPLIYTFVSVDPAEHGEDVGDHSSGGGVGDTGHH
jgi:hypothetical protein